MDNESNSTFKDIVTSFNAAMYHRITNPLIGSFIITWLAWNWRILLYIFNLNPNISIQNHILIIQDTYLSNLLYSFWGPFISALVISLGFPFLNIIFSFVTENANKMLLDQRTKIRDSRHPDRSEHISLLEKFRALSKKIEETEYDLKKERLDYESITSEHVTNLGALDEIVKAERRTNKNLKATIAQKDIEKEKLNDMFFLTTKKLEYYQESMKIQEPATTYESLILSELGRFLIVIIYLYLNRIPLISTKKIISPETFFAYEDAGLIKLEQPHDESFKDINHALEFSILKKGWATIRYLIEHFDRLINIGYTPAPPAKKRISIKDLFSTLYKSENNDNLQGKGIESKIRNGTFSLSPLDIEDIINPVL